MVIAWPINLNVSRMLDLYSLQRTWSPPGPHHPRRIGNNFKGKDIDVHFSFLNWETNYFIEHFHSFIQSNGFKYSYVIPIFQFKPMVKEFQVLLFNNDISVLVFNWNHFEMRPPNPRINFYLLWIFCPHLGSSCAVSSFTTFWPNFTSGLLQVIYGSRWALSEDSSFKSYPSRPEVYLVKNVVQ